jgi:hypothetical protein
MKPRLSLLRLLLRSLLALLVAASAAWGAGLLWFLPPLPGFRQGLALLVGAAGLAAALLVFTRLRQPALLLWLPVLLALGAWWASFTPSHERNWSADVARMPTGSVAGDVLTIANVRNFSWQAGNVATAERWETRSYRLSELVSLDLVMNYWMGPHIAHGQLSFGFRDGRQLIWSVEVRTRAGQAFDGLAGLFPGNELVFIAGDERDLIRRRTHAAPEDVRLYRLAVPAETARQLLLRYVEDANALAARPRFYNTLTTNCTTVIYALTRAIGVAVPADWRLLLNGHLPAYLAERGALAPGVPLSAIEAAAGITRRAQALPDDEHFSAGIRAGIPGMAAR